MTDNDFMSEETTEIIENAPKEVESNESKWIELYFSEFPKTIKNELIGWLEDFDYNSAKYNEFAVRFNIFFTKTVMKMFHPVRENENFFDLQTDFTSHTVFWKELAKLAEKHDYLVDSIDYVAFKQLVRISNKHDGFDLATHIYTKD